MIVSASDTVNLSGDTATFTSTGNAAKLHIQATSVSLTAAANADIVSTATDIELDAHRDLSVASAGGMLVKGKNANANINSFAVTSGNDLRIQSSALLSVVSTTNQINVVNIDKADWAFSTGSSVIDAQGGATTFVTERDLRMTTGTSFVAFSSKAASNIQSQGSKIHTDGALTFTAKNDVDVSVSALEASVVSNVDVVGGVANSFLIDANRVTSIASKSFTISTKATVAATSAKNLIVNSRDSISYTSIIPNTAGIAITATADALFDSHGNTAISSKLKFTLDGANGVQYTAIENFAATSTAETSFDNNGATTLSAEEMTLASTNGELQLLNNLKSISIAVTHSGVPTSYFSATGAQTGVIQGKNAVVFSNAATTANDADGSINIDGRTGITVTANKAITLTSSKVVEDIDVFADGSATFAAGTSGNIQSTGGDVTGNFLTSSTVTSSADLLVQSLAAAAVDERNVIVDVSGPGLLIGTTLFEVRSATTLLQANTNMRIAGGTQSIKSTGTTVTVTSPGGLITMNSDALSNSDFTIKGKTIASTSARNTTFVARNGVVDLQGSKLIVQGGNISISSGDFKKAKTTIKSGGLVEFSSGNNEALRYNAGTSISLSAKQSIAYSTVGTATGTYQLHEDNIAIAALKSDVCVTNLQNAFDVKADNYLAIEANNNVLVQSTANKIEAKSLEVGSTTFTSDGWDHDPLGVIAGFKEPLGILVRNAATTAGKETKLQATKNILIYGYEGVTHTSTAGTYKGVAANNILARTEHAQGITTLWAQKGKNTFTPTGTTLLRAGTSSFDGDLRLNATDEVKLLTTNANSPITFTQLGASSNEDEYGIRLVAFKDAMTLKAKQFTITASGTFNGTAESGAITAATTKQLKIDSIDRKLDFEGQTAVTLKSTAAIAFSSAGVDGETSVTSSSNMRLDTDTTTIAVTAVESLISSNNDLDMVSSAAVGLSGTNVDMLSGGSVSIVSTTKEIVVTSAGILDLNFENTIDIDSAAMTFSKDNGASIMRISAGGNDAEDGIDITSTGQVEHVVTTGAGNGPTLHHSGQIVDFRAADVVNMQTVAGVANNIDLSGDVVSLKVENGQFNVNFNNNNEPVTFSGTKGISVTTDTLIQFTNNVGAAATINLDLQKAELKLTAPVNIDLLAKTSLSISVSDEINIATKVDDITMTVQEKTATFQGDSFFKAEATTGLTIKQTNTAAAYTIQTAGTDSDIYFKSIGDLSAISLKNILLQSVNLVNVDATAGLTLKAKEENTFTGAGVSVVSDNLLQITADKAAQADVKSTAGSINLRTNGLASKSVFTFAKELKLNTPQQIKVKGNSIILNSQAADNAHTVNGGLNSNSNTLNVLGSAAMQLKGTVVTFTNKPNGILGTNGISLDSSNKIAVTSTSSIDIASKPSATITATQNLLVKGSAIGVTSRGSYDDSLSVTATNNIELSYKNAGTFTSADELKLITTDNFDITAAKVATYTASDIVLSSPAGLFTHTVKVNAAVKGERVVYNTRNALTFKSAKSVTINSNNDVNFHGTAITPSNANDKFLFTSRDGVNVNANVVQLISVPADGVTLTAAENVALFSRHGTTDLLATKTITETSKFVEFSSQGGPAVIAGKTFTIDAQTKASDTRFTSADGDITFSAAGKSIDIPGVATSKLFSFTAKRINIAAPNTEFKAKSDIDRFTLNANDLLTLKAVQTLTATARVDFNSKKDIEVNHKDENIVVKAGASLSVKSLGARSSITFKGGENNQFIGKTSTTITAKQNLGPNGGLFKFKSYNPHGIEIGSMFGSVGISQTTAAGTLTVNSGGNIQFRGKGGIAIKATKLGFFGETPVLQIGAPAVVICPKDGINFKCTGFITIQTALITAMTTVGLYS